MKTTKVKLGRHIKPESMTLNERINLRGAVAANRGLSYVNYNRKGEVTYKSPLLAGFEEVDGQKIETLELFVAQDTAIVHNKLLIENLDEISIHLTLYGEDGYGRNYWRQEGAGLDDILSVKDALWVGEAMAYFPTTKIWCRLDTLLTVLTNKEEIK